MAENPDGGGKNGASSVKTAFFTDGEGKKKASSLKTGVFRDEDL